MLTGWSIAEMAKRCARDIPEGAHVNLGIGLPEAVMTVQDGSKTVFYHTENGLLGMGPPPAAGEEDMDLTNAGKKPATAILGASYFHHADSFAMVRGGHIDICILGAMQVSQTGDLANWLTDDRSAIPAVGGAMDLVAGVKKIFVMTKHCTKDGLPKLLRSCTYPLTGKACVSRVYTDLGVFDVGPDGFVPLERFPGISIDELVSVTEGQIVFPVDQKEEAAR